MSDTNKLMIDLKDIIIKLKEVRQEKGFSYGDIMDLIEANGDFVSKSTIARVFAEGSEETAFRYEETIRPIAKAMLDIETIEEGDSADIGTMKYIIKYKMERIEELEERIKELESDLAKEKIKYHEKLDAERERSQKSIEFLKDQISLKDKRMDQLLEAVLGKEGKFYGK